ncbi:MAG: aromatic amino acid lyase [Lawsonibacter sp.]|nr:aromatic amino acid lyase [Lawsonibacter sp.]
MSVEQFVAVVRCDAQVGFTQAYEQRIQECRNRIEQFLRENRRIYGVTTGFGENVRYVIPPEDAVTLQKNIIHSHSCSVGRPLEIEQVRAIMLMQILNMGSGVPGQKSGTEQRIYDSPVHGGGPCVRNRILAHPASVDSVPTCANQEDPVSMAYTAKQLAIVSAFPLLIVMSPMLISGMIMLKNYKKYDTVDHSEASIVEKELICDFDENACM